MGVKTLYEYFYKLAYGAKGLVEHQKYVDNLDVADAQIEANKNPFSNTVQCSDYANPDDAITAIGASNKTLLVTEAETCDTNFTVPANVTVKFERGGKWTINTGITVTFNGSINAGLWQIFALTGTGTVVLNSGSCAEAYPEWWGAKGDGTTDDAAIFNSVLTQLNNSEVKTMKLNNYEYLITDTLILYAGISVIGQNNYPSTLTQSGITQPSLTKIIFSPTSEKDLFDITTVGAYSYVTKVYLGGFNIYGNTTGGVTYSRYAINSKAAQSVFENLGIERFQDGIYINYDMTNKYRDIYISKCSHACIYTSTSTNTTDIFENVIMRDSPWGAILRKAYKFSFINCAWESLTTGGVNVYRECSGVDFISGYGEGVPNSSAGDNYGMFYINHDGTTLGWGNINISGGRYTCPVAHYGSFLDIDKTSIVNRVSVINTEIIYYTNGIKASANTVNYTIYVAGISLSNNTNNYVDTTDKLSAGFNLSSAEFAEAISDETGTDKLVFNTSPTLVTPVLGVASATSINFGDNALSAYKEGEWTMGISFDGGTTGITYSGNTGYYTKVGNLVTVSGLLTLTSKGSSTGNAVITGLPFTVVNNSAGYSPVSLRFLNITFANQFQGFPVINTTTISLREVTEAGVETTLTEANFADTSAIMISCTYRIN